MSFPVPEPSVTYNGQQRTSAEVANEATAARREAQIRYALSQQPNAPQIIKQTAPQSEAELVRERNKRLQREGDSVTAFRHHLEAIASEREAVHARLFGLRSQADAALREGNTSKVRETRAKIEDATVQADRLDLLENDARNGLARAEATEAERRSALERQVPAAEATLRAFVKAYAEYSRHAAKIAEIVALEAPAEAAYRTLLQAAQVIESCEMPAPFPTLAGGKALRTSVVLPGHVSPPARRSTAMDAYER